VTSADEQPIIDRARELAAAGAWVELVQLGRQPAGAMADDAELRVLLGEALVRTGELREARDLVESTLRVLATRGEKALYRRATNLFGVVTFTLGELDVSYAAFTAALDLATRADDLLLLARASNNLGAIANLQSRHDGALLHYRAALPVYQRLGQRRGLAETYHNLAITYRDLGLLAEADEHERRALDYAADDVAPRVAAMAHIGRAEVALRRGDAPLAERTAQRAARTMAELDDPLNEANAHRLAGAASTAMGRLDDAFASFERALGIAVSLGYALVEADTRRDRADAFMRTNDTERARRDALEAIAIFRRLGATKEVEVLERRFASLE
jgi:tetratricopeptide (TPR) repeat protein